MTLIFLFNYSSITGFFGFNIKSYENLSVANDCEVVENWDISEMTDFSNLFADTVNFNCDLTGWDVSGVTNMDSIFYGSENF